MRGILLRALPVCVLAFTTGCILPGGSYSTANPTPTPTHTYWQKVNAILSRKPINTKVPTLLALVREQTNALRELPTDGVDADLVAAVDELIRCEDDVLEKGDNIKLLEENKFFATQFAEANKKASEAKSKLCALRDPLITQYGSGFAPMMGRR